ncbi:helix-turn-helix domain-containing protein [Deinococcus sp. A31D244]|uniref:helix-turn-helix domain-containing protein n=1 Tax=Deinococcus sp. A31D244 TaxID=3397675 RepID=UPI0039DFBCF2
MTNAPNPMYYTVLEASELLRCSEAHVTRLIRAGRLAAGNIGTDGRPRWRIPESALQLLKSEAE